MKLIPTFLIAPLLMLACSCSDDDFGPAAQLCETIVSFAGNSGDKALFEYQAIDDSPVVTLTVAGNLKGDVRPGTRLLIRYRLPSTANPAESAEVELLGLRHILTDTVTTAPLPDRTEQLTPIYLLTIQRSGQWIDLGTRMPQTRKRSLRITTSGATDAGGIADLWLDAEIDDTDPTYNSPTQGSVWIGPVWERSDVRGVRIHVNNSNNIYRKEFTFLKKES